MQNQYSPLAHQVVREIVSGRSTDRCFPPLHPDGSRRPGLLERTTLRVYGGAERGREKAAAVLPHRQIFEPIQSTTPLRFEPCTSAMPLPQPQQPATANALGQRTNSWPSLNRPLTVDDDTATGRASQRRNPSAQLTRRFLAQRGVPRPGASRVLCSV
jgi:hypothetical protein